MKFNDAAIGVFLLLFAVAEILYTRTFPQFQGQNYGPNIFPILIGVSLAICGGALLYKGLSQTESSGIVTVGDWAKNPKIILDIVLLLASVLLYVFFSNAIGFIPISIFTLSLLLYRLGSSLTKSVVIAMITTIVIHTVFAKVLLVPLPWGMLQAIAW